MKILLLNDNPVVNKLVTLSAQKTSDDLDVVNSIDDITSDTYNLLVIDDTLYTSNIFEELKEKITFSQSLYICSRDAQEVPQFDSILKKPFLPTDLVELFSVLSTQLDTIDLEDEQEDILINEDELIADTDEDFSLEDDDLILDDSLNESVLDSEEAQKVKDLLEDTEEELEETLEDDLDLELEDSLELEEEEASVEEEETEELDIEEQIKVAVNELSEEDLESELNDDALLEIVQNEVDSLDSLTSKDLKLAIGEDILDDELVVEEKEEDTIEELQPEDILTDNDTPNGVEALKNLLTALTDKNVAASMKGMKISINITLGDN